MKNSMKRGGISILTAILIVSAFVLPKTYAASAVDTDRTCSVQVNAPETGFAELQTLPVVVKFYKVADISAQGEYTAVGEFSVLSFSGEEFTKAAVWEKKAADAKEHVSEDTEETVRITLDRGTATAAGISTGLYLMDVQQVLSENYQYDFQPYLISLPNNYYYSGGNDGWVYDLTGTNAIGLKAEKTERYGNHSEEEKETQGPGTTTVETADTSMFVGYSVAMLVSGIVLLVWGIRTIMFRASG